MKPLAMRWMNHGCGTMNEKLNYQELYQWGTEQLGSADVPECQQDARLLLEWCCGTDRNTLLAHGDRQVSAEESDRYRDCITRRSARIPLQHITGEQAFMGLTFAVNENVLIPRQDTEILVEEAMRHLHDGMRILDLCTGSGCILLSLLHYSNGCTGVGADLSGEALRIAKENAIMVSGQDVIWIQSNLFENLGFGERFDMIVSNPPYIKTDVIDTLMPEVRFYEPHMALDGREDGLYFYRKITAQAGAYLNPEGMLFFEIGYDQGEAVRRLMEEAGYRDVEIVKDYAGLDRVVFGEYVRR